MQPAIAAQVLVDGAPRAGVTVALVAGGGAQLAEAVSDDAGRVTFAARGAGERWLVAKLHDPVVGLVAARVGDAPISLALSTESASLLAIAARLPDGAQVDWLELLLTPRAQPGVPPAVVGAATLVADGRSRRVAYHRLRTEDGRARLRVTRGTWDVVMEHVVDGPLVAFDPEPSWRGEARVAVDADTVATVAVGELETRE